MMSSALTSRSAVAARMVSGRLGGAGPRRGGAGGFWRRSASIPVTVAGDWAPPKAPVEYERRSTAAAGARRSARAAAFAHTPAARPARAVALLALVIGKPRLATLVVLIGRDRGVGGALLKPEGPGERLPQRLAPEAA